MDYTTLNNLGSGSHFWFSMLAILATAILTVVPMVLMGIATTKKAKDGGGLCFPPKYLVAWASIGTCISYVMWASWGIGVEKDIYEPKDDGFMNYTLSFPDEKPFVEREEDAEIWKSSSQRTFEDKIKKQQDPQRVLEQAIERSANREKAKQ